MTPTVEVRGLNYSYGQGDLRRQVLFEVDLIVRPGEILILSGPSGSGKTTLLSLIGALRAPQEGSVRVFGEELLGAGEAALTRLRRRMGFIFQGHNLLGFLNARQNVRMTLELSEHLPAQEMDRRAEAMLARVGLGDRAGCFPEELSGGQKQRVAVARALVGEPRLILADEPTAALDSRSGRDVVDLLQGLARGQGAAVILVTHDHRILDVADRIVHCEDGRLEPA